MAVVNTKATAITNDDAVPSVINSRLIDGGIVRSSVGTVEVAVADDDGSVYRFVRIPSGARITSINVFCDAITAGSVYHCGLYRTAVDGGAVVDADLFGATITMANARGVGMTVATADVLFFTLDIATIEKKIWEQLALAADPLIQYDICLTGATVGSAAGTLSLRVHWTL